MKKNTFILIFILLIYNNLKPQVTDNKKQQTNNKSYENYSKADWEGQGIYRNYKPEDEIIEKRTRSSKHFRNPDGTVTAIIAAGTSLNYEENGSWHSITREIEPNNSPEYSQYPFANTHNAFKSYYPYKGGYDGIVTVLKEGTINEWVNPSMFYIVNGEKVNIQKINTANVLVNDNEIIYKNIYNDIDIKFIQNNDSRKMNIILNNFNALSDAPLNATDLVFEETVKLPESWTIKEEEGCINVYDENNFWIARYDKPVFFDSGIDSRKGSDNRISGNCKILKKDNNLRVSIQVPVQWLKENKRKYPVFIDPTISIYPANTTFYTGYVEITGLPSSTIYTKYDDSLFNIGGNNTSSCFGFMRFDLSSIQSSMSILSGNIIYYAYSGLIYTGVSSFIKSITTDPTTSSGFSMNNSFQCSCYSTSWNNTNCWDTTSLPTTELSFIFSRRNSPGWEAYLLQLNGAMNTWRSFYGYSNSTYKPYLSITYCETPGALTNLSATPTGTTTANISWSPGTPVGSPNVRYYWEVYTTGGNFVVGSNTTSLSTAVSGLTAGTSYFFRVQANTTCDNTWSTWDTSAVFQTIGCTTPGVPVSLFSMPNGQNIATLIWATGTPAGNPNITYYWEVYTSGGVLVTSGSTSNTNTIVATLSCGTTYYFGVQANTSCDNSYSAWAVSSNFTTLACCVTPGTPTDLFATITGGTSATLQWNPGAIAGSPNVSYYWEVYTTGGLLFASGSTSGTNTSITSLVCGNTYYFRVQAYTTCNNSYSLWAVSSNFYATTLPPVMISTDRTNFCSNDSGNINLSTSGGAGTTLSWYIQGCGSTLIGTGNPLTIASPVITNVYYANWNETGCSPSTCLSVSVDVNTAPTAANFANAVPGTICNNYSGNITLSVSGGSGVTTVWYNVSCGSVPIGTGNPLVIAAPTVSLTYWANMQTQGCSNTSCVSIAIIVETSSIAPTLITVSNSNICLGSTTTLYRNGGSLGTGAKWVWYSTTCGGTFAGTGVNTTQSPIVTTIYYVRAEGICNTTNCISKTINVNLISVPADSITTTQGTICAGTSVTLAISGGNPGTGANWHWYSGACGSAFKGTGTTILISPTVTTFYFVRAEGTCNTTVCVSKTINVNNNSVSADSAIATFTTICNGSTTTLSIDGGSLGTGANWYWYSGSCGGNYIISGASLVLTPIVTTTYYVLAQGVCNTTTCVSVKIDVILVPSNPLSAIASPDTISSLASSTLSVNGILTTGVVWAWYENGCGSGDSVGTGTPIVVTPPGTTTYYVRAENGICFSNCVSITVTIPGSLNSPTSITVSLNPVCSGQTTTISLTGTLNGGQWYWYSISCGGTYLGTGTSLVILPTITSNYYARQELGTLLSSCVAVLVNVNTLSVSATNVTGNTPICFGTNTTLGITSGSLGTGANWYWYSVSCGGTAEGNGFSLIVSPIVTTDYYVRAEGMCNTTNCINNTITVITLPSQPDTITGNANPSIGGTELYSVTNTPGVTYSWTAPTGWAGTSTTNSITYIVGTGSGSIIVTPSNACGTGLARTIIIQHSGYILNGYFTYNNIYNTPLDSVWVFLMQNGLKIDSVQADTNGYYQFNYVQNGTYNLNATTHKPWNGVNSTDAVKVKRHFAGSELFTTSIQLHAADVNLSFGINTTDAVKITRRFVGSDTTFTRGDWVFEKPIGGDTINVSVYMNDTVIVNGNNVTQDFVGLCVGDVNGSNLPLQGAKEGAKIELRSDKVMKIGAGERFDVPVFACEDLDISAVSIILKYQKNKIEIYPQTPLISNGANINILLSL